MLKTIILCGIFVFVSAAVTKQQCVVPFSSKVHWDVFWPLIFNSEGKLYPTKTFNDEDAIVIQPDETVIISCGPNYLKQRYTSRTEKVSATCKTDGKFQIEGESALNNPKDLACDLRTIEEVVTPVTGCPEEVTSVRYGFVHPNDNLAHVIGEACYCTKEGRTLFAHLRLNSTDTKISIESKTYFGQVHPPSRYKLDFMKAFHLDEFNNRLRNLHLTTIPSFKMSRFVDENLLWNHQLWATKKLAWNFFIQHDNLFNLDLLKEDIADLKQDIDVYIGSHGVTTVKDNDDKKVPIYLDDERFPIPKLIWIAVKNDNKATAFAVINDPTLTKQELEQENLCTDKCESISWLKRVGATSYNSEHGIVLCCDYNELRTTVTEMPQIAGITDLYT